MIVDKWFEYKNFKRELDRRIRLNEIDQSERDHLIQDYCRKYKL